MSNADGENLDSNGFDLEGDEFDLADDGMFASEDDLAAAEEEDSAAAEEELVPVVDDVPAVDDVPVVDDSVVSGPADDDLAPEEPVAGEGLDDISDLERELPDEAVEEEEEETADLSSAGDAAKTGPGLIGYAVWAICGISCLCLIAANVKIFLSVGSQAIIFLVFMNLLWLLATLIPFLLWVGRKSVTVYTVMLGLSLAGVLIGIGLLLMELVRYGGDIQAKGARQTAHVAAVVQASDNTTATA